MHETNMRFLFRLVQDLSKIGYTWPALVKKEEDVRGTQIRQKDRVETWDPITPGFFRRMSDVTLIVTYKASVPATVPQLIQKMYQAVFAQVW
jgi:hypothetical protein